MIVPDRRLSWFRLLFEVRGSTLPRISGRLLTVLAVSCVVTIEAYITGYLEFNLSIVPFTLVSVALGIFLGFRNNTAYDRYWEGRKLWGTLVNDTRTFTRLVLSTISVHATPSPKLDEAGTADLQRDLVYRTIAYAHALRMHLRNDATDLTPLAPFIPADELTQLARHHNVPIAILQMLSARVEAARRAGVLRNRDVHLFENMLTDMCNVQGGCERIKNTPFPFSYTLLMHTIVAGYCFALPFGLVATTRLATPVVVALIAYAFLGLDAVGDELEEPFGSDYNDLPLETLSRMIEVNLRQLLGEESVPPLLTPDSNGVSI